MSEDLERKLGAWADQAEPVSAAEARRRADAGGRAAGDDATGPRRLLAVAAAVLLLGAVAIGGWMLANDGGDGTTGVDTVDQPATSTTLEVTTTRDTTTTTAVPESGEAVAPNLIVVHSADHRLEVLDRNTGDTVRVLAEFDDPAAEVPGGEPATGRYLGPFVVSPDGQSVYYESCCEPAAGEVFRIPITGEEPNFRTFGTSPAVSPDGTKLAVIALQGLEVIDLVDRSSQRYSPASDDFPTALTSLSWSPDGSQLVLERYDDSLDDGRVILVSLDDGEDALATATTVAEVDADGTPMHPVFDADGNIVVIRQASALDRSGGARAETYPADGQSQPITTVELDGPVMSQRTAGGGRFLIRTFADGTLVAEVGGSKTFRIFDRGYLDAAW